MILFTTCSRHLDTRLYHYFCALKPPIMWFKCVICHQTYSHKCNLKRHMDSAHMHKVHKCNLCEKEFKRREYLIRHLKQAHKTSSNSRTFSQIADCVSTEQSPVLDLSNSSPTNDWDDVDVFLNSLEDIPIEAPLPGSYLAPSHTVSSRYLHDASECLYSD